MSPLYVETTFTFFHSSADEQQSHFIPLPERARRGPGKAGAPLRSHFLMLRCFLTEYPGRATHLVWKFLRLAVMLELDRGWVEARVRRQQG